MAIHTFTNGLINPQVKYNICGVSGKTLKETIEAAVQYSTKIARLEGLNSAQNFRNSVAANYTQGAPITCQLCKKIGHTAKE